MIGTVGGVCLQLLAPLTPDSPVARFLDRTGPGLHHVAFGVVDVAAVAMMLRERGLRVLYDDARRGTSKSWINFVHPADTGGVLVEIVESALARPERTAKPG
jgi:methylmalonyl-CoA/ethylmalonyl-CoA epimerase